MLPDQELEGVILLAEDDPNIRETTTDLLSLTGARIHAVASGRAASEMLERVAVDLVVTDMIMPDGDGEWLLAYIRNSPRHRALPVIVLSARADLSELATQDKPRADQYMGKPYDPERLLTTVGRWLRDAHARKSTPPTPE